MWSDIGSWEKEVEWLWRLFAEVWGSGFFGSSLSQVKSLKVFDCNIDSMTIGLICSENVWKMAAFFRDQSILTFFDNPPFFNILKKMRTNVRIFVELATNGKGGFS